MTLHNDRYLYFKFFIFCSCPQKGMGIWKRNHTFNRQKYGKVLDQKKIKLTDNLNLEKRRHSA